MSELTLSTNFNDDDQPLSDWISQAEAARLHGVSRQAIHKLVQGGRLRGKKIGGRIFVSRSELEIFRPLAPGRPLKESDPKSIEKIRKLLDLCSKEEKAEIIQLLKEEVPKHPLEVRLGVSAEIILGALERAGDLTIRMIRGVIAEAAFEVYIVKQLVGWENSPLTGNLSYDFLLEDSVGPVRVQVKLQRSQANRPLNAKFAGAISPDHFVVETQRTRSGRDKSGDSTRPYRFGEFDILSVAMQPSTGKWDSFLYTVSDWLIPSEKNEAYLATFQPVSRLPNEDWTDDFETCVSWLRSGKKKTIRGKH